MAIVVTTPTGKIGSKVLTQLVKAGKDVSVIVRNPNKLDASVKDKVKIIEGSLLDLDVVTKGFRDASIIFWVTPMDWLAPDKFSHNSALADVASKALRETKVANVVNLSSVGATLDKAGAISALRIVELRLNDVVDNVTHLRPGLFYEIFIHQIEAMKNSGAFYKSIPGDLKLPMIANQDIADVAASFLLNGIEKGITNLKLLGPENLSMNEAITFISESVGKPLRYIEISVDEIYQRFLKRGASPSVAKSFIDMELSAVYLSKRSEPGMIETTTPTKFKNWVDLNLVPLF